MGPIPRDIGKNVYNIPSTHDQLRMETCEVMASFSMVTWITDPTLDVHVSRPMRNILQGRGYGEYCLLTVRRGAYVYSRFVPIVGDFSNCIIPWWQRLWPCLKSLISHALPNSHLILSPKDAYASQCLLCGSRVQFSKMSLCSDAICSRLSLMSDIEIACV